MKLVSSLALALLVAVPVHAQKKPVTAADYGKFETPGAAALSPNGQWLAYAITRVNEENELRVRPIARDTTLVVQYGGGAQFSADSRWLAYTIGVSPAERDRLTRERKPVRTKVGVRNVTTGEVAVFDDIASFRFSPDARFVALRGYPPEGKRTTDMIVRDLLAGTATHFGNVTDYAWAGDGSLMAIAVETESNNGNAVQLFDAATGTLRVLDSSSSLYRGLAWREKARDLAVLRSRTANEGFRDTAYSALAWTGVGTRTESRRELTAAIADSLRITNTRAPTWTRDGAAVLLGLRPRLRTPVRDSTRRSSSDAVSDVQVWHGGDLRIIPEQKAQEQQDLNRSMVSLWRIADNRLHQLATSLTDAPTLVEGSRWVVDTETEPYETGNMFGRPWRDTYIIDLQTGERHKLIEKVREYIGADPTGRYIAWSKDGRFYSYDLTTKIQRHISPGLDGQFTDSLYDTPTDALPTFGQSRFTSNGGLLVNDRYDVWLLSLGGGEPRRLTNGAPRTPIAAGATGAASNRLVYRLSNLSFGERGVDLAKPVYFTIFDEDTKRSGVARMQPGREPEMLLLEDARVTRLMRADSADVFAYTRERFDDAPDWFVGDATLRDARQVSRLNPFQHDYAWGKSDLVEYTIPSGRRLHGILLYPANYDASREYPMIVYTYEMLSQGLHNYVVPSERSYYNFNVWSADGYFVLMPDIVYRAREPGPAALEAVTAAVDAAKQRVRIGRIGLVGHSWGGYQAAYLPTRTNLFAASVAGAPITNFLSFAGAIHWTPGIAEFSHWETGQARMEVPYWEDFDAYLRSSPAYKVHELKTPMLMMFGDADGTVDWHQGVEFYNFARRAGRDDFVMLVYPGEDHSLRKKENQIDYHRRINEWFAHWLKGEPAAKWITEGVSWLQRRDALGGR
jgi:dipeptidyl aminopeptidase/acylaminoacyl peptidase